MKVRFLDQESELHLCGLSGLLPRICASQSSLLFLWLGSHRKETEVHPFSTLIPYTSQACTRQSVITKPRLFMNSMLSSGMSDCCCRLPLWSHTSTRWGTASRQTDRQTGREAERQAERLMSQSPATKSDLLRLICMTRIREQCLLTVKPTCFLFSCG